MNTLKQHLSNWVEYEDAGLHLARLLGVVAPDKAYYEVKGTFEVRNPLGDSVFNLIYALIDQKIIEVNDENQIRWNPEYKGP